MTTAESPRKAPALSEMIWREESSLNDFVTDPLNQRLAYGKNPFGKFLFIGDPAVPKHMSLEIFRSDFDEITLTARSMRSTSAMTDIISPESVYGFRAFENQKRMSRVLEQYLGARSTIATLDITYWENAVDDGVSFDESLSQSTPQVDSRLSRIRLDLQSWLNASVDDLAMLLRLSPTTIINFSKPDRTVRPKTARKMVVVHSLILELQRVIGTESALAWTQTVGRRLLLDGDLTTFEQFVSSAIFPEPASRNLRSTHFGNDTSELLTKPLTPIGTVTQL